MPAGVPILASVVGSALGLGAIGTAVLALGASVAMGVFGGSLFGKKGGPGQSPRDLKRTVRGSVEPRKVVYGWARIGGPLVKVASTGEANRDLHMMVALCQGAVTDIPHVFLNEAIYQNTGGLAYLDGSPRDYGLKGQVDWRSVDLANPTPAEAGAIDAMPGFLNVFPADYSFDGQRLYDQGRNTVIRAWTGQPGQPADAAAIADIEGWTEDHRGLGIAYLYAKLTHESADVWPSGIPSLSAIVQGRPVYDPRKDSTQSGGSGAHRADDPDSWEWSRNPVLCALDYIRAGSVDIDWPDGVPPFQGLAAPDAEIDWGHVMAAANLCDEDVPGKLPLAAAVEPQTIGSSLIPVTGSGDLAELALAISDNASTALEATGAVVQARFSFQVPVANSGLTNLRLRLAGSHTVGATLETGAVLLPFDTQGSGTVRQASLGRISGQTVTFTVSWRNDGLVSDPWWIAWQVIGDLDAGSDAAQDDVPVADSRASDDPIGNTGTPMAVPTVTIVAMVPTAVASVAVSDASWFAFQQDNAAAATVDGTTPYNQLRGDVWIEVDFTAPVDGDYNLRAVARAGGYVVVDGLTSYAAQSWTVNPPAVTQVPLTAGPHRIAFVYARNEGGGTDFGTNPAYIAATLRDPADSTTIVSSRSAATDVFMTGTTRRYTLDGVVTLDQAPIEVLERMATSMAGRIVYAQGSWRFYPGAWSAPILTLDEDDLRGPLQLRPRAALSDAFNGVRARYVEPAALYEETEMPGLTTEPDPSLQVWREVELPFTLREHRAQRIASIVLRRQRFPLEVVFPAKLAGLPPLPGECVALTVARFGWTAKAFLVERWAFAEDGGVDLVLSEEDPSIYAYDIMAERLAAQGGRVAVPVRAGQSIGDPQGPGDPIPLSYANQTYVRRTGDAMSGPLVLPADPAEPLQAATKQYVDASGGGVSLGLVIGVS
ncbi:phage tail protein [Oceanibaculum indicum]|uniref:Phage tail protein n=1 Tax=Oceanibaculum indicum P24 TaxID=1207063 RepID=K2K4S6_9PROT|nr:phage tail protein [Oceanibaculum indicum]EKE72480.1 phage tail protein [Oceanibaculum indicum P24]